MIIDPKGYLNGGLMRQANVSDKILYKRLAKDVYDDLGRMLLGKGVEITPKLLDSLIDKDVYFVYIDDALSEGIEVKGIIDDTEMLKSVNKVKHILNQATKDQSNGVSMMIREQDIKAVEDIIGDLIDLLLNSDQTLYTVVDLMGADMYTYKHSVNVAILSILTCRSLGYNYDITKYIAMGALLHDVGKSQVKDNLIQKVDALSSSELEEVHDHAIYGYDLVKNDVSLSGYTKQIIHLHHEKRDGSGYPKGLKEAQIPDFVRIVTICDIFDAMTSNRVYRKGMPPYKAIEILMADSVYKLDPIILQMFLKNICVYPPGTGVKLSDGRLGLVKEYNLYNPTRPVVRVYEDEEGQHLISNLDLEEVRTIFVEETVETYHIEEKYQL